MIDWGYVWFRMRLACWYGPHDWLRERLPWWIAFHLPRKVALFAFVRVYGVIGECGPDYARVYAAWERRS